MAADTSRFSQAFSIVVSGPSGVGKSSVVERLLRDDPALRLSVSMTTRQPRDGEVDGRDYDFVADDVFRGGIDRGMFAESAEVHGHLYGTPRSEIDRWLEQGIDVLLDLDYQGGLSIMQAYPECISIFILPPSFEELERRLRLRASDSEAQIARRLEVASKEMAQAHRYMYLVINEEVDEAARMVADIIAAERQRVMRFHPDVLGRLTRPAMPAGGGHDASATPGDEG